MAESKLDAVVSLAKRRGFVFPAGEIYGGTRSAWDYGPLGVALKENIKEQFCRFRTFKPPLKKMIVNLLMQGTMGSLGRSQRCPTIL